MKHVFIIDPDAFAGYQWKMDGLLDSIGQYFRTQDRPDFTAAVSKYPREALGIIQKRADDADGEPVRVYAVGGDGILFDCLNGIAGLPNIELAAIPYGTANTFVRSFGDGNVEAFNNIASAIAAPSILADVIEVGNTFALSGCAVGLNAAVAAKMREAEGSKRLARSPSRLATGMRRLLARISCAHDKSVAACHYKIEIDSRDYSGSYSLVSVVNAPYFGRRKIPLPGATPDDGFLHVLLFRAAAPLKTLLALKKYSDGRLPPNCVRVKAKKVEVRSDRPMWIQQDDEYLMDTNVTFEAIPGAVRIVAVNDLAFQE